MARAYLRICVEPGKESPVRDALRDLSGVVSAEITTGQQDVMALVEADSFEDIMDMVVKYLRHMNGVKMTYTNPVLD